MIYRAPRGMIYGSAFSQSRITVRIPDGMTAGILSTIRRRRISYRVSDISSAGADITVPERGRYHFRDPTPSTRALTRTARSCASVRYSSGVRLSYLPPALPDESAFFSSKVRGPSTRTLRGGGRRSPSRLCRRTGADEDRHATLSRRPPPSRRNCRSGG